MKVKRRLNDPVESYGYIDYAKLAEKLRLFGVTWYLESFAWRKPLGRREGTPMICGDPHGIIYGPEGDTVVICDGETRTIYEVRMIDYEILWETSPWSDVPCSVDYNPTVDRFLALTNGGRLLVELDRRGKVVRSLSSVQYGSINAGLYGNRVAYDPLEPSKYFWLADQGNHVVYKAGWDGKVAWIFGEWGVPGSDDAHLNNPYSVSPIAHDVWFPNTKEGVWIGDGYNCRVLWVNCDSKAVWSRFPFPAPKVKARSPFLMGLCSPGLPCLGSVGGGFVQPAQSLIVDERFRPIFIWSEPSNEISFHPTDPYRVLFTWMMSLYEVDLRLLRRELMVQPRQVPILRGVPSGTSFISLPVTCYGYRVKTIKVIATQGGSCAIQVPRFTGGPGGEWTGGWDTFDTMSLTANTPAVYPTEALEGVFRLNVSLSASGTVDAWVMLEP